GRGGLDGDVAVLVPEVTPAPGEIGLRASALFARVGSINSCAPQATARIGRSPGARVAACMAVSPLARQLPRAWLGTSESEGMGTCVRVPGLAHLTELIAQSDSQRPGTFGC